MLRSALAAGRGAFFGGGRSPPLLAASTPSIGREMTTMRRSSSPPTTTVVVVGGAFSTSSSTTTIPHPHHSHLEGESHAGIRRCGVGGMARFETPCHRPPRHCVLLRLIHVPAVPDRRRGKNKNKKNKKTSANDKSKKAAGSGGGGGRRRKRAKGGARRRRSSSQLDEVEVDQASSSPLPAHRRQHSVTTTSPAGGGVEAMMRDGNRTDPAVWTSGLATKWYAAESSTPAVLALLCSLRDGTYHDRRAGGGVEDEFGRGNIAEEDGIVVKEGNILKAGEGDEAASVDDEEEEASVASSSHSEDEGPTLDPRRPPYALEAEVSRIEPSARYDHGGVSSVLPPLPSLLASGADSIVSVANEAPVLPVASPASDPMNESVAVESRPLPPPSLPADDSTKGVVVVGGDDEGTSRDGDGEEEGDESSISDRVDVSAPSSPESSHRFRRRRVSIRPVNDLFSSSRRGTA